MAAKEAPKIVPSFEEFVDQVLQPTNLPDFKSPFTYDAININVYRNFSSGQPTETISITDIYPFHTIFDLCTRIYLEAGEKEEFHPANQCLLLETRPNRYLNLRFLFGESNLELESPLTRVKGKPDPQFVDITGEPKIIKITPRDSFLLDSVLLKENKSEYTLHLFLYPDFVSAFPGAKPIGRTAWEGIFRPYFTDYNKENEDGALPEDILEFAPTLSTRFGEKLLLLQSLDGILQEGRALRKPGESTRSSSVNLSNFRNLRFAWRKPSKNPYYKPFSLESIFYEMPVSILVPYIRFFPKSKTPISKINVEGPFNKPTLEEPEILFKWSQDKSVTPEEELLVAKILVREGSGSIHPLYATLFIFEEGSAKLIIQPNADEKNLTRQADLFTLGKRLDTVMATIPPLQPLPSASAQFKAKSIYTSENIYLEDAYTVLSLWLERDDPSEITQKTIATNLKYFRGFFQVTDSPIKEQNPIAFLRYKGVNDFRTPSRDFQFLNRIVDLQKISGKNSLKELVEYYKEEFNVSDAVANERVTQFFDSSASFQLVDPEIRDFTQTDNPGIDIAIFGKYPYYTFHIYRINSLLTLQRIKTLLSLLITLEPADLEGSVGVREAVLGAQEEELEEVLGAEEEQREVLRSYQQEAREEIPAPVLTRAAAAEAVASALGDEEQQFAFDDGFGDFDGFGEEGEAPSSLLGEGAKAPLPAAGGGGGGSSTSSKLPLATLAKVDEEESPMPAEKAIPKGKGKGKEKVKEEGDIESLQDLQEEPANHYFIKRLQFYDKKLFSYKTTHPSLKKYPSMCAANALKQPVVMTEDEYSRMREIYEEDETNGKVLWIDYPLKPKTSLPTPANTKTEIITTLRYGSNLFPGQANIYICSEYWCRKDNIVILKSDFESVRDKKGRPKEKYSCPFCHGTLILDRTVAVKGETIIQRVAHGKKHLHVRFLGKTSHPEGLHLPCCFIDNKESQIPFEHKHPAYQSLGQKAKVFINEPKKANYIEPVVAGLAAELAPVKAVLKSISSEISYPADYKRRISDLTSIYIVGGEKLPLEVNRDGPQIGVLPPAIDAFFAQKSVPNLVKQNHTVWKIISQGGKLKVSGFLRIGVENRKKFQADSLFAAIAPYYGINSANELRGRLSELITPPVFLGLNYGNLLFDFYSPQTPDPKSLIILKLFSKTLLVDTGIGAQREALLRAWKGYTAFKLFLNSAETQKEFRHFSQFFSQPNLLHWIDHVGEIRNNGILFIVLEINAKGELHVRCPPYGVKPDSNADIAFILHYPDFGIWEPIFYTRNDLEAEEEIHETYFVFRQDSKADWPDIVKQRVKEYYQMCKTSGLGIYTDSYAIQSNTLLPLSKAIEGQEEFVNAILKDTYNHVSAVLFTDPETEKIIVVPVIDDGTLYPTIHIELDWRNFLHKLAPADVVDKFYLETLSLVLPEDIKENYEIQNLVRLDKTIPQREDVYAIHLKNGLFVPVSKPTVEMEETLESEEAQELPWMLDNKLVFGEVAPEVSTTIDHREFQEIYEHLRFTFSNWLALSAPSLKQEINEILFHNGGPNMLLPRWEKRQRLFIKLGNEIKSWLDYTIPVPDRKPTLKRFDCRVLRDAGSCTNRCVWREADSQCLLHIPEKYDVGEREVDTNILLIRKLIDELIQFPQKRDELLDQRVSQYVKINQPLRIGSQYIIPENLSSWTEFLRMEWKDKKADRPKYVEEFIMIEPTSEEESPNVQEVEVEAPQEEEEENEEEDEE